MNSEKKTTLIPQPDRRQTETESTQVLRVQTALRAGELRVRPEEAAAFRWLQNRRI